MRTRRIAAITVGSAALLTLGAATVIGQTPTSTASSSEQVAQYVTDRLKTELELTTDQVPKVHAINVKSATQLQNLLTKFDADTTLASDAAFVKGLVAAAQSRNDELRKVLTPAQWTRHQQSRAERMALNQTELMAYTLGLSRSQVLDVERINMASANKVLRALEQPTTGAKRTNEQRLAAARPVMQERDAALEKVLTAAQWKEMQENRRALRDLFLQEASTAPSAPAAAPRPKP